MKMYVSIKLRSHRYAIVDLPNGHCQDKDDMLDSTVRRITEIKKTDILSNLWHRNRFLVTYFFFFVLVK